MKFRHSWSDLASAALDLFLGVAVFCALVLLALALSGCAQTVATTVPSPVDAVSDGNFQMRLHQTRGDGQAGVASGLLASPYGRAESTAAGHAHGCTLTVLGNTPALIAAELRAGDCRATLGSSTPGE